VNRFEDSIAWQKARGMAAEIYAVTSKPPFSRDFGLASQIQRAAVSVMANIAEGFDLYGDNQFHHALTIAKGSCAEVRSHLYIAHDIGYLDQSQLDRLVALNIEVTRLVSALRSSVDQRRRAQDRRPQ
jgi:four helix bundle protein